MTRWVIGDIQGCFDELQLLLAKLRFSADRDRLWFVGDLVNRGPKSLETLRFVRALGANAEVVLGNHDLHLLAVALGSDRLLRSDDTLDAVLAARDRERVIEWLLHRPLAYRDATGGELLVHAGVLPQWSAPQVLELAAEVSTALRRDPRGFFDHMYGSKPDRWKASLTGRDRWRITINALTRLRFCSADGRMNLKLKGAPYEAHPPWMPWYAVPDRASRDTRIVIGHWSTLGFLDAHGILAVDTGCVWGGALSAVNLDADPTRGPVSVPCSGYQAPGGDG
jgi:bis(5'-nucleosyl)-tetraphosphatase (symmetrical)